MKGMHQSLCSLVHGIPGGKYIGPEQGMWPSLELLQDEGHHYSKITSFVRCVCKKVTCRHSYTYMHAHVHCAFTHTYMHTHTQTHTHAHAHVHTHTHMHMYTHTHTPHTHTYTRTHSIPQCRRM